MRVAKAGNRLVHRIVERLGGEMMQRALVGAADIHAGAAAHRLQTFEDLDILGGIAVGCLVRLRAAVEKICHGAIADRVIDRIARTRQAGCGENMFRNHNNIWARSTPRQPMPIGIMELNRVARDLRDHDDDQRAQDLGSGAAAGAAAWQRRGRQIAEREAERLRSGDDELTCVVWCWIARSTAELLRPEPGAGERIH